MQPCVLYFSRTGNTKRAAEAIAKAVNAPIFDLLSFDSSKIEECDLLIFGTPVEGFKPAKETLEHLEHIPKGDGKKVILFCISPVKGIRLKHSIFPSKVIPALAKHQKRYKPDKPELYRL